MLSTFSFSDDTLGFLIDGKFDKHINDGLHAQVRERIEMFENINLYMEDSTIKVVTFRAWWSQVRFKIDHAHHIEKIALVSDKRWIRWCGIIENLFIPIEIRVFKVDQRMNAISWIAYR